MAGHTAWREIRAQRMAEAVVQEADEQARREREAREHLVDGTEITDEVLEALAGEAEAGYDLSQARRRYVEPG